MTLPYRLHPLAEDDLVAAWSWYEEQVQGLGDQFLDVVRLTIELAADWPNSGAPVVYDTTGEVTERKVATLLSATLDEDGRGCWRRCWRGWPGWVTAWRGSSGRGRLGVS